MPPHSSAARASIGLWARLLVSSLVEAGVRHAVISPGARSTPLVLAATSTPGLRCHRAIDERSAAFFALGQARATLVPSLLICTSGTAAANYYPAVIEARESDVPLLVVSADRPSELQYRGAPQTIDQLRLFGPYAKFFAVGEPDSSADAQLALRSLAHQAVASASAPGSIPVHINFAARKPLEAGFEDPLPALPPAPPARFARPVLSPAPELVRHLVARLSTARMPLVMATARPAASAHGSDELTELVQELVQRSGALLCAEGVSQFRFARSPALQAASLDAFEWLLDEPALDTTVAPDFILQLGASPMSSGLQRLLARSQGSTLAVTGRRPPDAFHKSALAVEADEAQTVAALCAELPQAAARPASAALLDLNRAAWRHVEAAVESDFTEAAVVREVVDRVPAGSWLSVGNSLVPRHLDRYCPAAPRGILIASQRGVSGIEGALASALGLASAQPHPVTLLVGDIAALHDIGSLWLAASERTGAPAPSQPIVAVIVNNAGGRIFEHLPVSDPAETAREFWTTPHAVDFEALARGYGVAFHRARDAGSLHQALSAAYASAGLSWLEVVVPPGGALSTRREASARLRALLPSRAE